MISICICNLGKYNEGELWCDWIVLPCSKDKLQQVFTKIGINKNYEEWFICDYSSDLQSVSNAICEYSSVDALNRLAERLDELEQHEIDLLEAVAEADSAMGINTLLNLTYNLDCYCLYLDVHTHEELGEYFIYELSALEVPEHLISYFDFQSYGRDLSYDGTFTAYGYLEQIGTIVDRA